MSAYSDYKVGAISMEEYKTATRMEAARDEWENTHEELPACEDCIYYDDPNILCDGHNEICDDFMDWRDAGGEE